MQVFGDPHLLRTSRGSIFGFHFRFVARPRFQPFDLVVHRIAWRCSCRKRLEVLLRSLQCPLNARIDVVTLLEVYVFKEVAADRSGGNRVAVHFDSLHMGNRSFHRHQPLAQVFIDTWGVVSSCHRGIPARSELAPVMLSGDTRIRHPPLRTQKAKEIVEPGKRKSGLPRAVFARGALVYPERSTRGVIRSSQFPYTRCATNSKVCHPPSNVYRGSLFTTPLRYSRTISSTWASPFAG